jgi:methionine sulfoxide reductase heme-binding subunit
MLSADRTVKRFFLKSILTSKWSKVAVFGLCLVPLTRLVWKGVHQDLGANPVEFIQRDLGDWIMIFLVATLAVTPARRILRQPNLIRFRRMLGLFAFFYACLHFTTYIWLDQSLSFSAMMKDVGKRPFVTAGFTAFLLLVPLAVTSTAGWIRRLGGKGWQRLHKLIYISAMAGVVHYYWLVKSDVRRPVAYGLVLGLLLAYRVGAWLVRKQYGTAGRIQRRPELTTTKPAETA